MTTTESRADETITIPAGGKNVYLHTFYDDPVEYARAKADHPNGQDKAAAPVADPFDPARFYRSRYYVLVEKLSDGRTLTMHLHGPREYVRIEPEVQS